MTTEKNSCRRRSGAHLWRRSFLLLTNCVRKCSRDYSRFTLVRPDRSFYQHIIGGFDAQPFAQQRSQPFLLKFFRLLVGLPHQAFERFNFRFVLPATQLDKFLEVDFVFSATFFNHGVPPSPRLPRHKAPASEGGR